MASHENADLQHAISYFDTYQPVHLRKLSSVLDFDSLKYNVYIITYSRSSPVKLLEDTKQIAKQMVFAVFSLDLVFTYQKGKIGGYRN